MQLRDLFADLPHASAAVVPLELQQLLREDLDASADWERAEALLQRAQDAMPGRLETRIARYKLYAYSNRFEQALALIEEVLASAAQGAGFSADWRSLHSGSAAWHPAEGDVRHYLYTLKAMGFVHLRRGDIDGALAVLEKLRELDPQDQVGGSVVHDIACGLRDDAEA
ncbi:hypothetical protein E4634_03470 [Mangrovimicrobium sediminis]|uniref:Uncharacterized protein n=1 Tax=Mangrovimicrobium sediminis TaxID=2562682 RepID=A0A4Z0M5Y5_9GAMM|nr:hypothetical protein [Haliea sp. SAOS-164]TGD75082.1 hypothetical protein E4634_03470 [Haliea sp. SAOS-164]